MADMQRGRARGAAVISQVKPDPVVAQEIHAISASAEETIKK